MPSVLRLTRGARFQAHVLCPIRYSIIKKKLLSYDAANRHFSYTIVNKKHCSNTTGTCQVMTERRLQQVFETMIVFETCQPLNKHQRQLQQPDVFFVSSPASLFPAQEEWSNVWTKRLSLWPVHSLAFVQTLPAVHHLEWSAAKISITEISINQIRE